MHIFHKAKHWQIFLLIFGIPFVGFILTVLKLEVITNKVMAVGFEVDHPEEVMKLVIDMFTWVLLLSIVASVLVYAWQWSIGVGLQYKLPEQVKIKTTLFKVGIIIQVINVVGMIFFMRSMMAMLSDMMEYPENISNPGVMLGGFAVLMPLQLASMGFIFYSFYFVAKVFKTVELQREVNFSDFSTEFVLIWFSFIGVWLIQPKVNQITAAPDFNP